MICWSGSVAVFGRDLDRLTDGRLGAPPAAQVAWQAIHQRAQAQFPGWTLTQVNGPAGPGSAAETWAEDEQGVLRRIYSDPSTGEVLGATSYLNIQRFFRSFHMSLFIGELPLFGIPLGYLVVGLFAFVLLGSAVTSLVFYKRFWRGFFRLHKDRGPRVFWSDLHKLTGLWSLWFFLVIGLTGVWYLVEWKAPEGPAAPAAPEAIDAAQLLPLDRLIASARRSYPELVIKSVATYDLPAGLLEVQGQDGSVLVRDRAAKAWVNAFDGRVIAVQRPRDLTLYQRWIDTADPLHFGDFGGLLTKAIWFLFGLAMSGLCLTGAYLQAKRQRVRALDSHRRSTLGAYLATCAALALSCVYGFKEALSYSSDGTLPALETGQVAIIGAWIASTLAILSAWMWKVR